MARSKVKTLLATFGVLVALLAVVLVIVIFYLGNVVKAAAETLGPRVTGTTLTLESAKVRPLRGSASLSGLVVGNPPGYAAPNAIVLKELNVQLEPRSLLTDTILIHSVLIDGPEITLEGSLTDNNLTKIKEHATGGAKKAKPEAPGKPGDVEKEKTPAKHVIIEKLEIRGCKLNYGNMLELPVRDITMTDIGKGEPMTMERAIALLLDKVLATSLGEFGGTKGLFDKGMKELGHAMDGVAKGGTTRETGATNSDAIKQVHKALDSLFLKSGQQEQSSEK